MLRIRLAITLTAAALPLVVSLTLSAPSGWQYPSAVVATWAAMVALAASTYLLAPHFVRCAARRRLGRSLTIAVVALLLAYPIFSSLYGLVYGDLVEMILHSPAVALFTMHVTLPTTLLVAAFWYWRIRVACIRWHTLQRDRTRHPRPS